MNKFIPIALSLFLSLAAHAASAEEPALSTYTEQSSDLSIKASWPRFGLARPDRESDDLVRRCVDNFREEAGQYLKELQVMKEQSPDMPDYVFEMDLEGSMHGNGKVTGMLWKAYQYTGGAHGNLLVFSRNYVSSDGKPVGLHDIFRKPEKALALMSELTRKKLLEQELPWDMVEGGTTPEEENFNTFLLEENGLTVYFNPYQVGPWAAGVVTVTLPLSALSEAQPVMSFWK
ncbi:DUF3298 and DUF4163 domain-containing protein [uncultured Mailhella sp.]|uniref:DUF3298 and DUF4163 domain-containing protein n=1 Tax=uncultured Mailhella sp. TaxID=1981031 RepID=UPI0025E1785B|nr:DUF3298 and DUF4163 domain-containing protein [uncultured Mailhella sp.]